MDAQSSHDVNLCEKFINFYYKILKPSSATDCSQASTLTFVN